MSYRFSADFVIPIELDSAYEAINSNW